MIPELGQFALILALLVALAIEIATVRARRRAAIERARTTEVEGASSTLTAAPDAASKS